MPWCRTPELREFQKLACAVGEHLLVLAFLQQLNREGSTIILITHDNGIAATARRIVRISDGKIVEDHAQEVDWI